MYLYAVQDSNGREVVSTETDAEKVEAAHEGNSFVLKAGQEQLASGELNPSHVAPYTLFRWPADDKLSAPESFEVTEQQEPAESDTPPMEAAPASEPTK